ncbi:radical SAM family heme chaperone HemW [bacterium]|nr:radical SAM family heme chaperone HemW [bacterium]
MAGIYIHVPFCKQACHYCDFHFSTSLKNKKPLIDGILKELELRKAYLHSKKIDTIYFGGGTPSLLDTEEIQQILAQIKTLFKVATDAEITLEANPDDLTIPKIRSLKAAGINRLSIGIQSFYDEDLSDMNRAHNANEAKVVVQNCLNQGFKHLSIDLIYGGTTLSDENWIQNLRTAFNSGINHLSAYSLTVEPKTALSSFIAKGKKAPLEDEKSIRHFEILKSMAKEHGFEHYEISNLAKPGHYSTHNTNYWKGKPYLGVGPSAHSFDGETRQWNIRNNSQYIKLVSEKGAYFEQEQLSPYDQYNEYMMTALRTTWGVDFNRIQERFGAELLSYLEEQIQQISNNLIEETAIGFKLSTAGMNVADTVISECFWVKN